MCDTNSTLFSIILYKDDVVMSGDVSHCISEVRFLSPVATHRHLCYYSLTENVDV